MIQWGWIDSIAELARRVRFLEDSTAKTKLGDVHEIETVPCVSQSNHSDDMMQTHPLADVEKIFAAPLRLSGNMTLRRLSVICSAQGGHTANVGMCLYRLEDLSRVNELNIKSESPLILHKMLSSQWVHLDGATHVRFDINYSREPFLSSANAVYYVAWTADSEHARFFCPNPTPGAVDASKSFRAAFLTNGTAGNLEAFPDTLTIIGDATTPAVPCVVGRSAVGIRVFGSFTDD